MRNKKYLERGLAPLIILLVIVLVGGAFYFGILKSKLASISLKQTPSPFPSSSADPTANWKTYTIKNNVSFKYPASLQVKAFDDKSLLLSGNDGIHEFRVNTFTIPAGVTLYQFIYDGGVGNNYGKEYLSGNNISLTFKDVSENSLYKIWEPSSWPSTNGIFIRFIQNKDQLVWFSLEPYNAGGTPITNEKEYVQTFDQILSTFKFTN